MVHGFETIVTRKVHKCVVCGVEIPKGSRVKFCTVITFYGRSTGYYYQTKQYHCNKCNPVEASV